MMFMNEVMLKEMYGKIIKLCKARHQENFLTSFLEISEDHSQLAV